MNNTTTALVALFLGASSLSASALSPPDMRGESTSSIILNGDASSDEMTVTSSTKPLSKSLSGLSNGIGADSEKDSRVTSGDNFALPRIDTYNHERPRVTDSDPGTRSVVDFRLSNRHGIGYRALAMMSRSHFPVGATGDVLSTEAAAQFGAFLEKAPSDAPAVMVYYPAGRALGSEQMQSETVAELRTLSQSIRSDLDIEVDIAGAWPKWVSNDKGPLGRLELLYPAF